MQEETGVNSTSTQDEAREYREFRRRKREEEARANVAKIECDCLSVFSDKTVLRETCRSAERLALGAVVVYPVYVKACVSFLGKDPKCSLIASISCPHGLDTTEIKAAAVKRAVKDGVDEVEVYAPVTMIKDGNFAYFKRECKKLRRAVKNRALRVVFDCAAFNPRELAKACTIAADAGVNCLRLNGADGETVAAVRQAVKGKTLVKAEGAESVAAFTNLCAMGADFVSSKSACELATLVLRQAEQEG